MNYMYFSKIAQKATERINYLGFVSSSYAFNHDVDSNRSYIYFKKLWIDEEVMQTLSENTPLCKLAQNILTYFQSSTSLSIHEIMNNNAFFSSIFENQKSMLIKCVRYMLEKNLIILIEEGTLTDDSRFVFNDKPTVKGDSIKNIRLRQTFSKEGL